ncbi:MAG TPA: flagellar biosynthesis anti-sigma factor FlgM [Syntrophorhabdaceae bacterium]|nr:flagellar biosynthesis anti-sigma factor FlgM [Syntrophorhabdaceae bacterium]
MKIEKDTQTDVLNTLSKPAGTKSPQKASAANEMAKAKDSVEFSAAKNDVSRLIARVKETPTIRQDKVDVIKAAIENGTYKIDSEQVVKSILKNNLLDEML